MWRGTRRLLLLTVPSPVKLVNARLRNEAKLALSRNPHGSAAALIDDCVACAVDKLMAEAGGPAWDPAGFGQLRDSVRGSLADTVFGVVERVRRILAIAYDLERRLAATRAPALLPALADIRSQLSGLVYAGFVAATGWWRLPDLVRYLRAIERRLDRLPDNPQRDREQMHTIQEIQREYARLRAQLPPSDNLAGIRWMIEELRVNYFAQALGTPQPISDRRIYRAMDDLTGQTS
jgi:ATP-dependent helicase HrpA